MKKSNKILAVLMALVMILTAVPMMTAGAAEEHEHVFAVKVVGDKEVKADPTCTEEGYTVYACTVDGCDTTVTDPVDKLGHDVINIPVKKDVDDGYHQQFCKTCKKMVDVEHSFATLDADNEANKDATCTATGIKVMKCACGETKEETIPALGHTYSAVVSEGKGELDKHSGVCTVCNATVPEAHKWDDGVVTVKPQCAAKGVKTFACTVCKETRTEEIDTSHTLPEKATSVGENGHKYVCQVVGCGYETAVVAHKTVVTVGEASKCDNSVALTITCEDCDYKLETKATQHSFKSVEQYDDDNHKQVCASCDLTVVSTHNWEDVKVVEATCAKAGSKETKCKDCGKTATVEIPKLTEHTYGEWTVVTPATYTEKGVQERACTVEGCTAKETEEIAKLEYKVGDVNGDGKVGAVDARLILQHVANIRELSAAELARADIVGNGDGVKATDARKVLQIVAGLE